MQQRPSELNLANWRQPGHGRWSFHHVREIVPSEPISRARASSELTRSPVKAISRVTVPGLDGADWSLAQWLEVSSSDALLVAHRGELVHEWYVDDDIATHPHIVFSVSKSITALLGE